MKKTVSVSLGGYIFNIEEDAYDQLRSYLDSIRRHFSQLPDADEVVADMEARMAEKFLGSVTGPSKIVTIKEVSELIASMGRPEDFGKDAAPVAGQPASAAPRPPYGSKKLMRDQDDRVLGGVCSGIAAYLGIEAVWVRLVAVVTIFLGGYGILLYLLLWLILPEAKTPTEKMQMRGEPVTLQAVEQTLKDKSETIRGIKEPAKRMGADVARGTSTVLRRLVQVLGKLIALALTIAAALGIAGLVFSLALILANANSPYVDFPVRELISGVPYYLILFSGFIAALIPLILLLLVSGGLFRGRISISKPISVSMVVLWVVAASTFASLMTRYAPEVQAKLENSPSYQTVTKTYDVKDFQRLHLTGANRYTVRKGDAFRVEATGRQRDLDATDVKAEDGLLDISRQYSNRICIFCTSERLHFTITMPELSALDVSGASVAETEQFDADTFTIQLSGASRATVSVDAAELKADISGASRLTASGVTPQLFLASSGASRFEGAGLEAQDAEAKLSGASRAVVNVQGNLTVDASGSSRLEYVGNPKIEQRTSDASRVSPASGDSSTGPSDFEPLMWIEPAQE